MAKARRQMQEVIKRVDVVLELVDARLPLASSNPLIAELAGSKPRVQILTRIDLADEKQTSAWEKYFQESGYSCLPVDAKSGKGIQRLLPLLETILKDKRLRDAKRGIRPRPFRAMVAGIPNVGKSSFINRMARKASTKTGDRPGVTKTQQWIRLGEIELLDTPGVLWPKLDNQVAAHKLAVSGAIKSDILDAQELAAFFIVWAGNHYPSALLDRYQVTAPIGVQWTSAGEVWSEVEPVLEAIAEKRGLLGGRGVMDLERAASLVVRELQTGQLGRMSLEWPSELGV
ncbi:ribosome biogenesis GTPase YlqF [Alicyclobacillus sp. SO9]|nr:ribosome biogenesis GTPase YlqF [Alicyclobacillus sp. SO9]